MRRCDPHGSPLPFTGRRFLVGAPRHDPEDEAGWTHKLHVIDRAYCDSDGYPIEAVAAGDTWEEAFKTAGYFIDEALASKECVF